jgi:hypothetical protein
MEARDREWSSIRKVLKEEEEEEGEAKGRTHFFLGGRLGGGY